MSSIKNRNSFESADVREKNRVVEGTLYLVSTPIGNLSDLSERAIKVLSEVDFIAAEDTRNTLVLLNKFEIKKELVSYFEHNKRQRGELICDRLAAGESCALVTDAGTPAISDPGEDLVRLCAERNIPVTAVPGCCAAIDALALSGLFTGRFAFEGFLPSNTRERKERLEEVKNDRRTLIFYEAPHKLRKTLEDFFEYFGDRSISLCRELTKLNEEVCRTTISEAIRIYSERNPRGEYVLVIAGKDPCESETANEGLTPEQAVERYVADGMPKMDAIKAAAKDFKMTKSELYRQLNVQK